MLTDTRWFPRTSVLAPGFDLPGIGAANNLIDASLIETLIALVAFEDLQVRTESAPSAKAIRRGFRQTDLKRNEKPCIRSYCSDVARLARPSLRDPSRVLFHRPQGHEFMHGRRR